MERLASEAAAESGLGWVRPTLEGWIGYAETEGLRQLPVETPPLSDEECIAVEDLETKIADCVAILEDEVSADDAREEAETRVRTLNGRLEAIINKPPVIPDDLKSRVGAFLTLDDEGRPKLDTRLFTEASSGDPADAAGGGDGAQSTAAPGRPKGLSQRLADELAMQRRDILAIHVAADPSLALDLAIFLMVDRDSGCSSEKSGSSLSASPPSDPLFGFKTPGTAASIARAESDQALDRGWTGGKTRAGRFDAFRALSEDARAAWLGHAVARTLEASVGIAGERCCAFHDHLGRMLGIDVARWWRPTGTNYFDRVPKSLALAALTEIGGPDFAGRYGNARKAELAQNCERIFAGDFIGDAEMKDAALAWVPDAMRFTDPAAPVPDLSSAGTDPDVPDDEPGDTVAEQPCGPAEGPIEEAA